MTPVPICLKLDRQVDIRACSRAWAKTGNRIAARMAMMAMTTSNSINVKPVRFLIGSSTPRKGEMTEPSFGARQQIPAAPSALIEATAQAAAVRGDPTVDSLADGVKTGEPPQGT